MKDGSLLLVCGTEKEPEMGRTLHYLGKMGYRFFGSARGYVSETPGLTIARCRDIDIPKMFGIKRSAADIAICSGAALEEVGSDTVKLLEIPYGGRKLIVYANQLYSQIENIKNLAGKSIQVNTSWPNTSDRYCRKNGITPAIHKQSEPGAITDETPDIIGIEYMPEHELWNDHIIIDRETSPNGAIIVAPHSYEANRDRIDGFVYRFKMALDSEGRRLLKFNVPKADLPKMRKYLPAMKAPTYASLFGYKGWVAVETILPNDQVEIVIGKLKKNTRAMGFLDQELGGVDVSLRHSKER